METRQMRTVHDERSTGDVGSSFFFYIDNDGNISRINTSFSFIEKTLRDNGINENLRQSNIGTTLKIVYSKFRISQNANPMFPMLYGGFFAVPKYGEIFTCLTDAFYKALIIDTGLLLEVFDVETDLQQEVLKFNT